jgi:D-glycero-D-manno-heptose 1,7-bisphosphate phosphatase
LGRRAVFLDRDGVLNRSKVYDGKTFAPRCLDDFELMPDALSATKTLHDAGLLLIVVTNQPDVANGLIPKATVDAMHDRLCAALPIHAVKVCFHNEDDHCLCRKPKPGMLQAAGMEMDIDFAKSFMVGDRWKDVAAGRSQGCYTILIGRAYSEPLSELPDARVGSLLEAAKLILSQIQDEDHDVVHQRP